MCGIVALFLRALRASSSSSTSSPDNAARLDDLRRRVARLRHRGPDGEGAFGDGRVFLAQTRLAITGMFEQPIALIK